MERTLKVMKESGVFKLFLKDIEEGMTKEDFDKVMDGIIVKHDWLVDIFCEEFHQLGLDILWEELLRESKIPPKQEKVVIVTQGYNRYLFSCPDGIDLAEGDRVLCDTKKGKTEGVCFSKSLSVDEDTLKVIGKLLGASFPLKSVIGRYELKKF